MILSGSRSTRRVLACDDEHQILRALKLTLRGAGYEVLPAATIEEALDAAALTPVDAAIVDLLLPDGDGVELCTRLREWSEMPIIVLSAVDEEAQNASRCRRLCDQADRPGGARGAA